MTTTEQVKATPDPLPTCRQHLINQARFLRGKKATKYGLATRSLPTQELVEELKKQHAGYTPCHSSPIGQPEIEAIAETAVAFNPASILPSTPRSLTHRELKTLIANAPGDLVSGLIPEESVDIFVGDSGLGKTPLLVQLGLSVSAGVPFLDYETRRAAVLYVDYENGGTGFDALLDKLGGFIGLSETPNAFRHLQQPGSTEDVITEIKVLHALHPDLPQLVIVDALRGLGPAAESKNEAASELITKLQTLARELGLSVLILHHIRKDNPNAPQASLNDSEIMDWLQRAAGARALINQTNVRFGIDSHKVGDAELILKGHYKLRGPFGPIQIARVYDDEGEPIGYRKLTGVGLLPSEQRDVFGKLPDEFKFSQAVKASGKGPKTVAEWLRGWRSAGVVTKFGEAKSKNARYEKVKPGGDR
jgi:AAA domain